MESSNLLDLLYASALEWNQDEPLLNGAEFTQRSREEDLIDPYFGSHMVQVQDLGFAKIKEELSEEQTLRHEISSYLPPPPPSTLLNGDLGLDPLSFGMILPTENIPSLYLPSVVPEPPQTSLSMDLHSLELLATSARFCRNTAPFQSSNIRSSPIFDSMDYAIAQHLQDSAHGRPMSLHKIGSLHHKMLPSVNGVIESKRANCNRTYQLKVSHGAPKKPRSESRPSLSPFKVRKEKLGDRIAALQQLVAPFGKTDTASVLMEAIGYIKFLQDQVETLSVPYMTSFNTKKLRTTEGVSADEKDSQKPDLRSRGLCLVPLSCTSYVTNIENGVWSPPNFMGGT